MKIEIIKRKLTYAGHSLLWANIFLTLIFIFSLFFFIRTKSIYYGIILMVSNIAILIFWIVLFIGDEGIFIKRYKIELNARRC